MDESGMQDGAFTESNLEFFQHFDSVATYDPLELVLPDSVILDEQEALHDRYLCQKPADYVASPAIGFPHSMSAITEASVGVPVTYSEQSLLGSSGYEVSYRETATCSTPAVHNMAWKESVSAPQLGATCHYTQQPNVAEASFISILEEQQHSHKYDRQSYNNNNNRDQPKSFHMEHRREAESLLSKAPILGNATFCYSNEQTFNGGLPWMHDHAGPDSVQAPGKNELPHVLVQQQQQQQQQQRAEAQPSFYYPRHQAHGDNRMTATFHGKSAMGLFRAGGVDEALGSYTPDDMICTSESPSPATPLKKTVSKKGRATAVRKQLSAKSKPGSTIGVPSKYCHICARDTQNGNPRALVCMNVAEGECRKIVCEICFPGSDVEFVMHSEGIVKFLCPHCEGICPDIARCKLYDRINAKRDGKKKVAATPATKQNIFTNSTFTGSIRDMMPTWGTQTMHNVPR